MSYPIYILDLGAKEYSILFPEGKVDINHSDYWEASVAQIVAGHFRLPVEELRNLCYCQRRARINDGIFYYGERQTKKLLRQIEKVVGETGLRFVYDEHEARLELTFWNSQPYVYRDVVLSIVDGAPVVPGSDASQSTRSVYVEVAVRVRQGKLCFVAQKKHFWMTPDQCDSCQSFACVRNSQFTLTYPDLRFALITRSALSGRQDRSHHRINSA